MYCTKNAINTTATLAPYPKFALQKTPITMHENVKGIARLVRVLLRNFLWNLFSFFAAIPETSPSTAKIIPKYSEGMPISCIILLLSIVKDSIIAEISAPKNIKFLSLVDFPNSLNELNKSLHSLYILYLSTLCFSSISLNLVERYSEIAVQIKHKIIGI